MMDMPGLQESLCLVKTKSLHKVCQWLVCNHSLWPCHGELKTERSWKADDSSRDPHITALLTNDDTESVFPKPFADHKAVGIQWST